MEGGESTSQDKLARLLEDGRISDAEYEQLANAMRRHRPALGSGVTKTRDRLCKDLERAWIAGVCAGLARHFNTDPVVPRIIAMAAVFLLGPVAAALYLIAGVIMPWDDPDAARASRADAHPLRFAVLVALFLVFLPFLYCAFVVPHVEALCERMGLEIWSSSFQGTLSGRAFDSASEYKYWPLTGVLTIAFFFCVGLHLLICNQRSRKILERAVIWSSVVWLLFLLAGTLLPLIRMGSKLQ
ncbi:MAG: PspC domain-containing protein [Candidatus Hydrogenedentes bacterium]|nr:PspC domain-containing protein [Candidatus Hydrogenedentota bacterium]